jgi:hypothetical protein
MRAEEEREAVAVDFTVCLEQAKNRQCRFALPKKIHAL